MQYAALLQNAKTASQSAEVQYKGGWLDGWMVGWLVAVLFLCPFVVRLSLLLHGKSGDRSSRLQAAAQQFVKENPKDVDVTVILG